MARGYSGAFGHKLNSPFVWLPLCAPLPRRPLRLAPAAADRQPRPAGPARLRRLATSSSTAPNIGVSVPLAYPLLVYLLARVPVDRVPRPGRPGCGPVWPAAVAADRRALPDGLPGRPEHGRLGRDRRRLRGRHRRRPDRRTANRSTATSPKTSTHGDTYGPVNYAAYVPFERDLALDRRTGTTCPPPTAPRSPSTSSPSPC